MRRTSLSPLPQKKTMLSGGGSKAASPIDPSLLEETLLMVQKLTKRVDDMEVWAADQKMSRGNTITWLCRHVRTFGIRVKTNDPFGRRRGG